ncbi:hypothetical protein E2C01_041589 [Portunus trituberculatus]|uniref:Uncharacterized protein n=1 Tax=Portunus trituberculatus TaxID=210409 RepID=A0A5B7FKD5_PORTR|nr:hypothetical protein [Portunus trituberculatus]
MVRPLNPATQNKKGEKSQAGHADRGLSDTGPLLTERTEEAVRGKGVSMPSCGRGDKARGQVSLPDGPSPKATGEEPGLPRQPTFPQSPPQLTGPEKGGSRTPLRTLEGGTLNCIRSGSEDKGTGGREGSVVWGVGAQNHANLLRSNKRVDRSKHLLLPRLKKQREVNSNRRLSALLESRIPSC